jgi:DNA repair exonuclease SbcCD ATPase subunit
MFMTSQFDAITYAQELEAAGVPKAQAEVHAKTLAHVVDECVVSSSQLMGVKRELENKISELETRLRAEIRETEARLTSKIDIGAAQLKAQIEASEARLRGEIDKLRNELHFYKWMNALTLALIVGLYVKSWLA